MPVGVHVSIAGGISRAVRRAEGLGCETMQVFGRNPRGWQVRVLDGKEAERFRRVRAGIGPVALHTSYLINLSSPDDDIFRRSLCLFKEELRIAEGIGADFVVTHLGSPLGMGEGYALERVVGALEEVAGTGVEILLENTAGGGHSFGSRLSQIGGILGRMRGVGPRLGFCFDTCHGFASGYPMRTEEEVDGLVERIDGEIGLERLRLIHLNDSKGGLGSRLDRHEHIGSGMIGMRGMRAVVNHPALCDIPFILETPKKTDADDRRNLEIVRSLREHAAARP